MTAKKVSELQALSAPAAEDLLLIVDDPSVDPTSKKITFANLTKTITSNVVSSNTITANAFVANVGLYVGVSSSNVVLSTTTLKISNSSSNTTITQGAVTSPSVVAVDVVANTVTATNVVATLSGNGANVTSIDANNISSGTLSVDRLPDDGRFDILSVKRIHESVSVISNANGVVNHDTSITQTYIHKNIANNFTMRLTNLSLAVGETTTATLILHQGNTPYIANSVQINGSTPTLVWLNGSEPAGTAGAKDLMFFRVILDLEGQYCVCGELKSYS